MSKVAKKGHNRVGGLDTKHLQSVIERIESLEEDKAGILGDIRDVYTEAKGNGFDVKAIRAIIKLRSMDPQKAEEEETIYDTYRRALGLLPELDEVV